MENPTGWIWMKKLKGEEKGEIDSCLFLSAKFLVFPGRPAAVVVAGSVVDEAPIVDQLLVEREGKGNT